MSSKNDQNLTVNEDLDTLMETWQKQLGKKIHLIWLKEDKPNGYCLVYSPIVDNMLTSREFIRKQEPYQIYNELLIMYKKSS